MEFHADIVIKIRYRSAHVVADGGSFCRFSKPQAPEGFRSVSIKIDAKAPSLY
jgi:hypothetical protein